MLVNNSGYEVLGLGLTWGETHRIASRSCNQQNELTVQFLLKMLIQWRQNSEWSVKLAALAIIAIFPEVFAKYGNNNRFQAVPSG